MTSRRTGEEEGKKRDGGLREGRKSTYVLLEVILNLLSQCHHLRRHALVRSEKLQKPNSL
jgi:hypothetical protein